jgi:hypothetical protein
LTYLQPQQFCEVRNSQPLHARKISHGLILS